MKALGRIRFVVLLSALLCATAKGAEVETVKKMFAESDRLVINSDCGWVAYNYEDSYATRKQIAENQEPFALASVMYTRHPVSAWENEDGSFDSSPPLNLLEDWMQTGRHVAFRIYANTADDLPAHVRESVGVIDPLETKGDIVRIAYWDPDYIAHHRKLVEFLGKHFSASSRLAYVDIGGVGDTGGEWYFGNRRAYDRTGLTDEIYLDMLKSFVNMYKEAFPQTRLFIAYDAIIQAKSRHEEALALILENNIGVRDDGLGGWPWPREHPPPETWPMPRFWPDVPVLFEGSGRGGGVYGWKMQRKDGVRILRWALRKCRPSYINIGGAETTSEKACAELKDLLLKYGRKLGYRFVLLEATYPTRLKPGATATIRMRWVNRGMSPCYADRKMELSLCDDAGTPVTAIQAMPDPPTTAWAPDSEQDVSMALSIPEIIEPGEYKLRVGILMGHPQAPERLLKTATANAETNGYITIGSIQIEP